MAWVALLVLMISAMCRFRRNVFWHTMFCKQRLLCLDEPVTLSWMPVCVMLWLQASKCSLAIPVISSTANEGVNVKALQEVGDHNSCRRHGQPSDVDMYLQFAQAAGASRSAPVCATHCHDPCTTLQRSPPAGPALLTPRQLQLQPLLPLGTPCPMRRSPRTWSWKDWRSCPR